MNCLILQESPNKSLTEIGIQLKARNVSVDIIKDPLLAIQHAQEHMVDVLLIDAHLKKIKIENAIRIFKGFNPHSRIIVKAHSNSKKLESRIRKEKVYYYYIDSFETMELLTALYSALEI